MAEVNNPGSGTGVKSRERILVEEPRQYKVIFHNDDFTTMEFVTDVLRRVFNKPADEAVALMMRCIARARPLWASIAMTWQ